METNSQLIKKIKEGRYNNVYPIAYIDGIIDKESNEKLSDILIRYNNIMVPWQGDVASTRNRVPSLMRRQGIVITYITDLSEIVTEVYKGTVEDIKNNWADNINWELVPDLKFVQDNASKLPDGTITPEKFSPALQELISQSGSVVNMPDDEDLEQKDMVLKFKDRPYNSELASGKGYKILRKNWTNVGTKTINLLTQDAFNQSNTIYEIRYNFDLNGAEITIPEGCVLDFQGGSLNNGLLKNNNIFEGDGCVCNNLYLKFEHISNIIIRNIKFNITNQSAHIIHMNSSSNILIDRVDIDAIPEEGYSRIDAGCIVIENSNDIKVVDCNIKGGKSSGNYSHNQGSICLIKCTNGLIDRCTTYKSAAESIVVAGGSFINITNCYGYDSGWSTVALSHIPDDTSVPKNIIIDNCHSYNAGASGFSFNAEDSIISNCLVKDNKEWNGIAVGHSRSGQRCKNVQIKNCIIDRDANTLPSGQKNAGLRIFAEGNVDISGVQFLGYEHRGIAISMFDNESGDLPSVNISKCSIANCNDAFYNEPDSYHVGSGTNNTIINITDSIVNKCVGGFISENKIGTVNISKNVFNNIEGNVFTAGGDIINNIILDSNKIINIKNHICTFYITVVTDSVIIKNNIILNPASNISLFYTRGTYSGKVCNTIIEGNYINNKENFYGFRCTVTNPNNLDIESSICRIKENTFVSNASVYYNDTPLLYRDIVYNNNVDITEQGFKMTSNRSGYESLPQLNDTYRGMNLYVTSFYKPSWWNGKRWVDESGFSIAPSKGSTSVRPNNFLNSDDTGKQFFDTQLGRLLFFIPGRDNVEWVDVHGHSGMGRYSGSNTQRPSLFTNDVGYRYFDTTLNKPIWWNGTKWVDATGADV